MIEQKKNIQSNGDREINGVYVHMTMFIINVYK